MPEGRFQEFDEVRVGFFAGTDVQADDRRLHARRRAESARGDPEKDFRIGLHARERAQVGVIARALARGNPLCGLQLDQEYRSFVAPARGQGTQQDRCGDVVGQVARQDCLLALSESGEINV